MRAMLLDFIREKSSRNGNPRYTALLVTRDGTPYQATTPPDSSYAALIPGYRGRWVYAGTAEKHGRLVLETIELATPPAAPLIINPRG